jgi:hypothetical protein
MYCPHGACSEFGTARQARRRLRRGCSSERAPPAAAHRLGAPSKLSLVRGAPSAASQRLRAGQQLSLVRGASQRGAVKRRQIEEAQYWIEVTQRSEKDAISLKTAPGEKERMWPGSPLPTAHCPLQ